jgi:hypothetical protein
MYKQSRPVFIQLRAPTQTRHEADGGGKRFRAAQNATLSPQQSSWVVDYFATLRLR